MSKFYIEILSASKDWQDDFTVGKIYPVTCHEVSGVGVKLITTNEGEPIKFPILYHKGEGIDWCDSNKSEYETQQYSPDSIALEEYTYSDFRVGNQLEPIGKFTTGYAQIIDVEDDVYTLLTDFGNIFDLSLIELKSRYEHIGLIDFDGNTIHGPHMTVEQRWDKQQELLAEAKSRLINMGYFKESNV